jgi:hypothetical protein
MENGVRGWAVKRLRLAGINKRGRAGRRGRRMVILILPVFTVFTVFTVVYLGMALGRWPD